MTNQLDEYKKAAGMMPGSVIIFQLQPDDTMRVFYYSRAAQALTGMAHSEVDQTIYPNGFNMILEDDQRVIIRKIREAIAHQEELDVTYRQHHKQSGVIWVHMKARIVGEIGGLPVFLAVMLEVTHEILNSSSIMEASDRSICVIEKHTKLLLYGNAQFYALIDRKPSDSAGVYCYDILCGNPAFRTDNRCLCFSTINIEKPFEYYNPDTKRFLSMYGREIMWGEHEAYVFFLTDQTEEKFKETQLKQAQERFEMTLDNSDLYIWEYDIVNSQCINSRKAVREYGLPLVIDNYPESLYDRGYTPPETIAQLKDVKQRLLRGETGFSVERRTLNGQGQSQWMKVTYSLEKDATGRPIRALVCGTDITEQKKKELAYEEELRLKKTVTSDTKILAILNLTRDAVSEKDTQDPQLAAFLTLGGVNAILDAVCDTLVIPSDREAYRARFSREKMLSSFDRGVLRDTFRHQFVHRTGWYESAYDLIQNPATGDVEAITSIRNVTDEVRSKQVVTKLTAIDYDVIVTADIETDELYRFDNNINSSIDSARKLSAREFHRSVIEDVKRHCTPAETARVMAETDTAVVLEQLKRVPVYSVMLTGLREGRTLRKRLIYTFLDDSHKTILCASQDVTEQYLQEEKQQRALSEALSAAEIANRAKTAFLSRVSHDMRTPLNGVLGLTALMKDEVTQPEVLQDLKQLELSGKYLLDLINDVLDVSSIESGKLELHPAVCDGRGVFSNIIKLAQPSMDGKDITFVVDAADLAVPPIFVDEARVQQVAMNVLGNAAKFTPRGGQVTFTARTLSAERGMVVDEFIVRDTGIGMDPAFIPHMFEPFSQENAATTSTKNGTGLGMSISKKIVELMNGRIDVQSAKGEGTTVTLTLQFPLATQQQLRESRAAVSPQVASYHLSGKRVLLCEDHPLNMQIARRVLEKVGVTVEHAENGAVGVDMFSRSPVDHYDAILMDVRMPVMDGLDAARAIRALFRRDAARIPIIAMTANALDEDVRNTSAAGMNAHLSKPIDPVQLYQHLEKYLNRASMIGKPKVLIVDDAEVNRAVLEAALSDTCELLEADNGRTALALLEANKDIAVVVTDIQMPEISGVELITQIRANDEYRHIALVAYTQYVEDGQEEMLLRLGVNDFIYKPTSPQVIALRVQNAMAKV